MLEEKIAQWDEETEPIALYKLKEAIHRNDYSSIRQYFSDGGTKTLLGNYYHPNIKELHITDSIEGFYEDVMILCERELR